jgi:hypothetical protein
MFEWLKKSWRLLFGSGKDLHPGYTNPRQEPAITSSVGPSGRMERLNRWCSAFMARQGGIVPAVSPESIYYKSVHPRRR